MKANFYINDGNAEDAIYYFSVAVDKVDIKNLTDEFLKLMQNFKINTPAFHATKIFKEKHPRVKFMKAIVLNVLRHLHELYFLTTHPDPIDRIQNARMFLRHHLKLEPSAFDFSTDFTITLIYLTELAYPWRVEKWDGMQTVDN